jgi:hypothetical protein
MKLKFLLSVLMVSCVAALGVQVCAAPISSRQSGNWSDPLTWQRNGNPSDNVVPGSGDTVTIQPGHTVTVDTTTAQSSALTINGTLSFSRIVSSELTISNGDVTVNPSSPPGTLDMGTPASPIPAGVTAVLTLAKGSGATRYYLIINDGAVFTSRGADKGTVALATSDLAGAPSGATSLQVPLAQTAG